MKMAWCSAAKGEPIVADWFVYGNTMDQLVEGQILA